MLSAKSYLTNYEEENQILLKKIIRTSTQSWRTYKHIREYDFSDEKYYKTFDLNSLMELILKPEN